MNYLEKFEKLPTVAKEYFSSDDPRWESEKACFLYGIAAENIPEITGPIGLAYVEDIKLKDLPETFAKSLNLDTRLAYGLAYEINKRLFSKFPDFYKDSQTLLEEWSKLKSEPVISEEEARKKLLELEPWILEIEKEERQEKEEERRAKEKFLANLITTTLPQALENYPEIGEQLITSSPIKLKNFPEPVRPSIKNWLADYAMNLGYGKHSAVDQSRYLFQGTNSRALKSKERQRLTYVLKSFDEKSTVTISKDPQQLIFPNFSEETPKSAGNINLSLNKPTPQQAPAQKTQVQFSPSQPTTKPNIQFPVNQPQTKPAASAPAPKDNIRFSFSQKMPYESRPSQPRPATPPDNNRKVSNANIVNLRDGR